MVSIFNESTRESFWPEIWPFNRYPTDGQKSMEQFYLALQMRVWERKGSCLSTFDMRPDEKLRLLEEEES